MKKLITQETNVRFLNKGGEKEMSQVIDLQDSVKESILKMAKISDGGYNPGAMKVLMDIFDQGHVIDPHTLGGGPSLVLLMDELNIRGEKIWMLYKDVCHQDLVKLIGVLRACQLGIIEPSTLMLAVMNGGFKIDVDRCMKKVREKLPRFKSE